MSEFAQNQYERLSREHREFYCRLAGAHVDNGVSARLTIDFWAEQFGDHGRAVLELMAWLIVVRERIGVETHGHA